MMDLKSSPILFTVDQKCNHCHFYLKSAYDVFKISQSLQTFALLLKDNLPPKTCKKIAQSGHTAQIPGELKQLNNREDPTLFVQVFK